jgi:acetylornithine deacetylase/succinyl-diaminopimelate desuccinylase-like protein
MDLRRLLTRALSIQAIPAPTFEEMARAEFLQAEFEHAGLLDVEKDEIGNLYGRVPGEDKSPVVVSAHLDTVFPIHTNLAAHRKGDRITGPGIGDNALSLSTLVELALDLTRSKPAGDVWLVANVCEEGLGNLRGMYKVVDRFGEQVGAYIVLEGMALGNIYHRGLRARRYRITATTEGGHSWIHAGKPSAIHIMLELGAEIVRLTLPETPRTTLNIGRMQGGKSVNSIAASAHLDIDLRSHDEETLVLMEEKLRSLAAAYAKDTAEIDVSIIGRRPGGEIEETHPLVRAAIRGLEEAGVKRYLLKSGSTDANVPLSMNLPAVCVGLTHGGGAHSMNEFIEISPIRTGYRSLLNLISAAFMLDSVD